MTRREKLDRYRYLRAIARKHQMAASALVARPTMMEYGRRLGIAQGNAFICDDAADLNYIYDLALYAQRAGRSRAIDRYARGLQAVPHRDDAVVLEAMQDSRFAIWRIEARHETAGLNILDQALNDTVWLMDEGMEFTAPMGSVFAGRLIKLDDFVMTTGAVVPMDTETILELGSLTPSYAADSRAAVVDDTRFQIGAFRAALRTGITRQIRFAEPAEVQREMATA